ANEAKGVKEALKYNVGHMEHHDVGSLDDEYYKLELSMVRCLSLGDATARTKKQKGIFLSLVNQGED
ncbi:hypothetical protein Tco_1361129, partial [Tanacetum coccineum]